MINLFELAKMKPVIEFKKGILDYEAYPEPGMRARLLYAEDEKDHAKIRVSYAEFDEYNKRFESHNYYDKNGVACLTAREANLYEIEENIWVEYDYLTYFKPLEDEKEVLLKSFEAREDSRQGYVDWLEQIALKALSNKEVADG